MHYKIQDMSKISSARKFEYSQNLTSIRQTTVAQTTDLHIIRNAFSQNALVIEEAATNKRWNTNLLDQKGRFL
jgi:hypothetical protein